MLAYIDRFQQYAVKHNLSAAAILLWQTLYLHMARNNQFERFQQDTAALMQMLQITRQGLIGVRKSLERVGLLAVERDENQKLWYTLQLEGQALQPVTQAAEQTEEETVNKGAEQTVDALLTHPSDAACEQDKYAFMGTDHRQAGREDGAAALGSVHDEATNRLTVPPMQSAAQEAMLAVSSHGPAAAALQAENGREDSAAFADFLLVEGGSFVQSMAFSNQPAPTGDIVMGRAYQTYNTAFCSHYDDSGLQSSLTGWMQQREQNGWTLTLWGLEELLKKLVQLAEGRAETMAEIVRQSVKRRWKGFHALKVQSRPCGEKLLRLEEKERRAYEKAHPKQPAMVRKLFGMGEASDEDLSFLEE